MSLRKILDNIHRDFVQNKIQFDTVKAINYGNLAALNSRIALFPIERDSAKIAAFQSRPGKWPIHSILCISSSSARATHIILGNDSQRPAANAPFRIDTQDRAALSRARTIAFDTALIASLASDVPTFAALPSALQNRWYSGMMQDATAANIRLEPAIRSFALAALLLGKNPAEHSETKHFFTDATLHEKDKARLALQIARKN